MQRRPKSELLLTLEKACRSHTDRERAEARLRGDGEATQGRGRQGRRRRSRAEQRPTAPGDVCIEGLTMPRTGRRLRNEPGAGEADGWVWRSRLWGADCSAGRGEHGEGKGPPGKQTGSPLDSSQLPALVSASPRNLRHVPRLSCKYTCSSSYVLTVPC